MAWYDVLHADRFMVLTGTYSNPTTTWTLPFTDDTLDVIVLGPDFGSAFGTALTPATNLDGTVTATGDYTAGEVIIGRLFPASVELSRPYIRDYNGQPYIKGRITMRELIVQYANTGYMKLRRSMTGRSDASVVLDEDPIKERGALAARFNGDVEQMTMYIENDTVKPFNVVTVEELVTRRARG